MSTELADMQAERFFQNVRRIAYNLRSLADRVEREATPRTTGPFGRPPSLARVAGDIIHELNWGFANLNADNLIAVAEDHREICELEEE